MQTIGVLNIAGKLQQEYIDCLEKEQYQVVSIEDKQKLEQEIKRVDGVIIFDENQENVGGVCNLILRIKKESKALIWTVSRKIPSVNRLVYLQLGASGNFEQGCDPEEFRLIVRNSLNDDRKLKNKPIKVKSTRSSIQLREENQCVVIDGEEIDLTRLEFRVLDILYKNSGKAVSYEKLHHEIWGGADDTSKMRIANLIFHLRQKMEKDMMDIQYIKTVRSKGYMLNIAN